MTAMLAWRALWLLVFTIPLENILTLPGVGSLSRIVGLVAMVACCGTVVIRRRLRRLGAFHIAVLAFALWAGLTLLWTVDAEMSGGRAWTYVQDVALALVIWQMAPDQSKQHKLMSAYVSGTYVAVVWMIVNVLTGSDAFVLTGKAGYQYDQRYVITGTDPNDLGLTLALAVPLAWYLATQTSSRAARIFYHLYVPGAILAIALTGSRGSLMALAVALLIVPLTVRHLGPVRIALIGLVTWLTVYVGATLVPQAVFQRLGTTVDQLGSGMLAGRSGIWAAGLEAFTKQPFLGYGTGAFAQAVFGVSTGSVDQMAHNAFLSVLVEHGLVGFLILVVALALAALPVARMPRLPRIMWMVLLLTLLTGASALSWEYRKPTWFLLGLLVAQGATGAVVRQARRRALRPSSWSAPITPAPSHAVA